MIPRPLLRASVECAPAPGKGMLTVRSTDSHGVSLKTFSGKRPGLVLFLCMNTFFHSSGETKPASADPENAHGTGEDESVARRDFLRFAALALAPLSLALWAGYVSSGSFKKPFSQTAMAGSFDLELEAILERNLHILGTDAAILWKRTQRAFLQHHQHMARQLCRAGENFCKKKLNRRAITALLSQMTRDHFDNEMRTEEWFEAHLDPFTSPVIDGYHAAITGEVDLFNERLLELIANFEARFAADVKAHPANAGELASGEVIKERVRLVFERQGIRITAGVGAGVAVAAPGLSYLALPSLRRFISGQMRRAVIRVLTPVAGKMIARLVAAGFSSAFPPAAVVVAAGGTIWTGIDIYRLRGQTERAFLRALEKVAFDTRVQLNEQVLTPISTALRSLQETDKLKKESMTALRRAPR